jgi:hypothetical protein
MLDDKLRDDEKRIKMKKEHNIMEIAIRQLDLAIRLFIKENEGAAAILLASASEETFAKELNKKGKVTLLTFAKACMEIENEITSKEVNDKHANRVKNWLKHADAPSLIYDEEEQAFQYILRAISNYFLLFGNFNKTHYEFEAYVKKNIPRLGTKMDLQMIEKAASSKAAS